MQSNEEIIAIVRRWIEGEFSISKTDRGNSSDSHIIATKKGTYILRCLPSETAAGQEYAVSRLLQDIGVTAAILPTRQGEPFVRVRDSYYNLQTFLPGCSPDLSDHAAIAAAADALAMMQRRFEHCSLTFSTFDRFDTMSLWEQAKPCAALLSSFFEGNGVADEMEAIIRNAENAMRKDQVIHGDLGSWNMLWNGERIFFIDFGECRLGDSYTDIAAIAASVLRAASDKERLCRSLNIFTDRYQKNYRALEKDRLRNALWLWLLRGALAVCISISEPMQREKRLRQYHLDFEKYRYWMANP